MDIRSERTRRMLIDAFEELQREKTIDEISVSELCELSTVRRATFYRHFEDKYAFYEYYLQTLTNRFLAAAAADAATDTEDLRTYATHMHRRLVEFAEDHTSTAKSSLGRTALAGTLDMMMKQMADGIAERIDREADTKGWTLAVPSDFLSILYAGAVMHSMRWWLFEEKPIPADEMVEASTSMLMEYLGSYQR